MAAVYGLLIGLHLLHRRRFYALSFEPPGTAPPAFVWEFMFFLSFAVVITLAVNLAGVLVVFAFLIIPAFSASLLARSVGRRLVLGWALGVLGSAAALWLSFAADLPVGPTVVAVFGLLPVLAIALRPRRRLH